MDLELVMNEALLDIVGALGIEMDVMKAEKIALETQTEEQFAAAYAKNKKSAHNAMPSVNLGKRSNSPPCMPRSKNSTNNAMLSVNLGKGILRTTGMIISGVSSCLLPEQGEHQNSKLMMTRKEELDT